VSIIEKAAGKLEKEKSSAEQTLRDNPIISGQKVADETSIQSRASRSIRMEADSAQEPGPISAVASAFTPAQAPRRITLNIERMRQYGIVTPDQGRTQIAEQFRVIKRPLLPTRLTEALG
jgi:hypothetical protein